MDRAYTRADTQQDAPRSLRPQYEIRLLMQKKDDQAKPIIKHVTEDFPDYFFGQMSLARKAIQSRDLKKARRILDHWMQTKKKFHITEFNLFCKTQIELLLQEDLIDGALSWLEMWEGTEPEDPDFEKYKTNLELLRIYSKRITKKRKG